MSDRMQYDNINSKSSQPLINRYGLPQQSVFGTLLFLIYNHDLCDTEGKIVTFADDTVLICRAGTWKEVFTKSENSLSVVEKWLNNNVLILNKIKIEYIPDSIIQRSQSLSNIDLCLHDCTEA